MLFKLFYYSTEPLYINGHEYNYSTLFRIVHQVWGDRNGCGAAIMPSAWPANEKNSDLSEYLRFSLEDHADLHGHCMCSGGRSYSYKVTPLRN